MTCKIFLHVLQHIKIRFYTLMYKNAYWYVFSVVKLEFLNFVDFSLEFCRISCELFTVGHILDIQYVICSINHKPVLAFYFCVISINQIYSISSFPVRKTQIMIWSMNKQECPISLVTSIPVKSMPLLVVT